MGSNLFPMKILHRSILKELVLAFVLSLASLNLILMTEKLLRLSRFLSGVGSSVGDMAKLMLYVQPPLLLMTIPMALLLSILLVYGRLNMDNEMVVMRGSGIDLVGISVPVAILGILCFVITVAVSFSLGPLCTIKLREETFAIIKKRTPVAIEEGRFNTVFRDIVIFVKERTSDNSVKDVFLYDGRSQPHRVLLAREGTFMVQDDFTIHLDLKNGSINMVKGESTTELYFGRYHMKLRLEAGPRNRKNAEMTPGELIQEIGKADGRERVSLFLELYRRFSLPLMCIILIFFGPPLAMIAGKAGKLGGLTIGLAIFTAYYLLLIYGENLARAGTISCHIGAWIATATLAVVALFVFWREYRR